MGPVVGDRLADIPACPCRRAPCCARAAVSCWPSARCWPSSPSCCPAEPARGESAPWLATCRQRQASDGDFTLWGGKMGFPWGAARPSTASWISAARRTCKPYPTLGEKKREQPFALAVASCIHAYKIYREITSAQTCSCFRPRVQVLLRLSRRAGAAGRPCCLLAGCWVLLNLLGSSRCLLWSLWSHFGPCLQLSLWRDFPLTAATGCCPPCPASLLMLHLLIFPLQLLVL